jgi:DNA polymerase I-like protein with 3'-5' exonuclease and polymerase domains
MRSDANGLFWTTPVAAPKKAGGRAKIVRELPTVPDTGWTMPQGFPRLGAAKALAIDVETRDEGLAAGQGPGWAWEGGGEVVGLSVCTDDGQAWYFPIEGRADRIVRCGFDRGALMRWASDELGRESQSKLGANIMYDIGWLRREGVIVRGRAHDVQFAEPLLDEHADSYSLGALCHKYDVAHGADGAAGKGAAEAALYEWLALAYGGKPTRKEQAKNIWRAPSELVGPYAEGDARQPFEIFRKQYRALRSEGLLDLYDLECRLIPLLVEMRWRGVRVDVARAQQLSEEIGERIAGLRARMGAEAEPGSPTWLAHAFAREGITVPRTVKGNPSVTAPWLEARAKEGVPLAKVIKELRRLEKAKGTFIDGYFISGEHNGRLHGEFHPLRSDDGGTVSGRFSSSNPNLQNIPSRDDEIKRWTRGLALAWLGERIFAVDYSQLEYRLMVHVAVGPGAEEARQRYRDDPATDYHALTQGLIRDLTGRLIPRKPIKNVNFGKIFGMGEGKLRAMLGMSEQEAHDFFLAYDKGVPFAKRTLEHFSRLAARQGYILTIGGRKARFDTWEPRRYNDRSGRDLPREAALEKWGRGIVRARTHKALNAYTQGGGGDIIKRAMVRIWEELDEVPLATVHDELVFSLPDGDDGQRRAEDIVQMMESVCPELSVPLIAEGKWGPNWGELK